MVGVTLLPVLSMARKERGQEVLSSEITIRALVLVISGCNNEVPWTLWHINNRTLHLTAMVAGSPRSRQHGPF